MNDENITDLSSQAANLTSRLPDLTLRRVD
jgi:hypothetical protein